MKILLIRFSSIGDIVITSPIVRCVRTKYPEAELHFLTKENYINLVSSNPFINKVISLKEGQEKNLIAELKTENYDLVIDLHKNLRTRRIKKHLRANWFSYKKLNIQKWLYVNFKLNLLPKKHLVDRYFDGIKSLEIFNDNKGLDYFFLSDISFDLSKYKLKQNEYIVVSIGGTYATKQIPNTVLLEVFKRLNVKIVLIGGGVSDGAKAEELCDRFQNNSLINLCNKLSIDESAFLIKNASSIVTGDTGMMHIASAFDTKIEAVWGNTNPLFGMYAYRSNNQGINNHQVSVACNPCSKLGSDKCPRGHFGCMNEQNIEQIVKNCLSIEPAQ
ncbi:glycosyltransferase family 9 protein [Bacteroidia bacterium]|nr:glycosyltransferase family 9 protein [Bacteroidia bacterium]